MRQKRSTDPWSTFLTPSGGQGGGTAPGRDERRVSAAEPSGEPSGPSGPSGPGSKPEPGHASGGGDDTDLPDRCRRVLGQLDAVGVPQTLEEIHHGTGLGLLEIAEAVEALRDSGLVAVEREVDEVVRRTGDLGPG
ncbi:hypothetical protein [Spirillospora sp. NPDC047279]|uniref:hypothetical protein n=1 Tax=Spirillospora sp. NPDC047279 TaxID=3155478 RepID=UPI0033DA0AEC